MKDEKEFISISAASIVHLPRQICTIFADVGKKWPQIKVEALELQPSSSARNWLWRGVDEP